MTREEYVQNNSIAIKNFPQTEWSEPKYDCPKCGGAMRKNTRLICPSYPPKFIYRCERCNYTEYLKF